MGVRGQDPGAARELSLDIARQANHLYLALKQANPQQLTSEFILNKPKYRSIARRVWTMGHNSWVIFR